MEPTEFEKFWAGMEGEIQTGAMRPIFKALVAAAWKRGRETLMVELEAWPYATLRLSDTIAEIRKRDARG